MKGHARPEFAIFLAVIGILLAIGIPALQRGSLIIGGVCIAGAIAVVLWLAVALLRSRS